MMGSNTAVTQFQSQCQNFQNEHQQSPTLLVKKPLLHQTSDVSCASSTYYIKLLLLGDAGVGKSSLMYRYSEGEFRRGLVGTAGVDCKTKNIELSSGPNCVNSVKM
mmetsp:Transcript_35059/g.26171  ORF Transcript_35059/g.26171 Transcript_35059/m.26171 type:complete len:106 (+) Transcript_35059:52-369(+)